MATVSRLHTLVYPTDPAVSRSGLEFAAKATADVRHYALDFGAFVGDARTAIDRVMVRCSGGLLADNITWSSSVVWLTLGGGSLAVPLPTLAIDLFLASGEVEEVVVVQPVVAVAPPLGNALAVGWQPVTFGGQVVEVLDLAELPGGLRASDLVLVVRPPAPGGSGRQVLGLAAIGALLGQAGGIRAFLDALPEVEPDSPGAAWWNGPTLSRTDPPT